MRGAVRPVRRMEQPDWRRTGERMIGSIRSSEEMPAHVSRAEAISEGGLASASVWSSKSISETPERAELYKQCIFRFFGLTN